ncbi:MAG: hypothetical protein L0215_19265 [Gemmataceae bacterium]|nr:hypothetical protein [Gemmataceae bacterium]
MPVDIEVIIERNLEQSFVETVEKRVRSTLEARLKKVFDKGSPFSTKLDARIEAAFERFLSSNALMVN